MRTLPLLPLILLLAACQTAPFVWVDDLPQTNFGKDPGYVIQVGDQIDIEVFKQKELSVRRTVRPDARVSVPLLGDVQVAGLTPVDAAAVIAGGLRDAQLVLDPNVVVSVEGGGQQPLITVLGEVKTPGQYPLAPGDNLLVILGKAGGLTEFAARESLFVIREDHEPRRIRFSYTRLSKGLGKGLSFRLADGDVVVVE